MRGLRHFRYALSARQDPASVADYRRRARRALPDMAWAYADWGADDMVTVRANRAAYGRWMLRQRALVGPGPLHTATTLAGVPLDVPLLLAPTGLNGLFHPDGDVAAARAAERSGTRLVLSTGASYSVEEVAHATRDDHFFQLYPWNDRSLTGRLIERVRDAGFRALFLTVDVPVLGNREGERRLGMGNPPTLTPRRVLDGALHPRWAYGFLRHQRISLRNMVDEGGIAAGLESVAIQERNITVEHLGWQDLAWVRDQWQGPLYVKGLLDADDAERAVDLGADGVVVSNHGGRQLDCTSATLDALPAVAERVGDRALVMVDGGIRRGTDVIKALCLGADACLIGRPLVYGLAAAGEDGVAGVLRILRDEIERAMVLMGCRDLGELDRSWLLPAEPTPAAFDDEMRNG